MLGISHVQSNLKRFNGKRLSTQVIEENYPDIVGRDLFRYDILLNKAGKSPYYFKRLLPVSNNPFN
jgi:hypothetical protein